MDEELKNHIDTRLSQTEGRIIELLQSIATRTDERFTELETQFQRVATRGEVRLRELEYGDAGAKERLRLIEEQLGTFDERLKRLENR